MKAIGQYFSSPSRLRPALVHRSYCNEHAGEESNERLEFLGDAVLALVISHRLYQLLPDSQEGDLTARRAQLVQTTTLALKATDLKLDTQLLMSRGEEETGGRTNPSLLANTFEAVLGALFLDQGLAACYAFLQDVFPDTELLDSHTAKNAKSLLQELAQAKGLGTPEYQTVSATGPDHAKTFVVAAVVGNKSVATGTGNSKQKAEVEAAQAALVKLFGPATGA